jgi:hypothetical protein
LNGEPLLAIDTELDPRVVSFNTNINPNDHHLPQRFLSSHSWPFMCHDILQIT